MSIRRGTVGLVCALVALVVVPRVNSQDTKDHKGHEGEAEAKMMAAWMKAGAPCEFHKYLQPLVGKWQTATKYRFSKESPWTESTGVSETKWAMGGRYIIEHVKSDSQMMPFEGMGTTGYDKTKKKYISTWIDSMSTTLMMSTGTIDDSHKVITFLATYDDPFTGQKNKQQKTTITIINENKIVTEMYERDRAGQWYRNLEVVYTRA